MDSQILELLNKKIEDQISIHSEALLEGRLEDYASYKELCGAIRGLRTAQREIGDLVRKLKENDE